MKTIYFVRHGESEANVGERFADDDTAPLTEKGRGQAVAVAKRCAKLRIDAIISSPMRRTAETAAIISEHIRMPFEISNEFVERPYPAGVHGRLKSDPEMKKLIQEYDWLDADVEGVESFKQIKDRAGRALALLEKKTEAHILVVTHGYFMRMILAYVFFGSELTLNEARHIVDAIPNTEKSHITMLRYYQDKRTDPWKLWVWNDHAHLG